MVQKRLLENPPSASASPSAEEDEVPRREYDPVGSDSETESDNNVSAFKIMPIISKSAIRVDPDESRDEKVIAAAANETPKKKNEKMKAEKRKLPVLSKKPDQMSSGQVNNVFANDTDVADVEMAEPSDEGNFHLLHVTLALPALTKKPQVSKSRREKVKLKDFPVGDKIVALSERSEDKKKVATKWAENNNVLGKKIESLSEGLKRKKKVEVVGDENEKEHFSSIGDGKGVWWEDLSKIESEKAEELKKKWKKLKEDELKLFILKNDLLKETASAVIDAMKASRS